MVNIMKIGFETYSETGEKIQLYSENTPRVTQYSERPARYWDTSVSNGFVVYSRYDPYTPVLPLKFWFDGGVVFRADVDELPDLYWPDFEVKTSDEYKDRTYIFFRYPESLKDSYFSDSYADNQSNYKICTNVILGVF